MGRHLANYNYNLPARQAESVQCVVYDCMFVRQAVGDETLCSGSLLL